MKCDHLMRVIVFFALVVLCSVVYEGEAISGGPLDQYAEEAREAYAESDFDGAIEACRKVLYVDQKNVRVLLLLADALEEKGKLKKAFFEYGVARESLQDDVRINANEKEKLKREIDNEMKALQERIDAQSIFAGATLTLFEMNLFALACTILLLFVAELIVKVSSVFASHRAKKEQSKIWVERYWEKHKEKEIKRFPVFLIVHFFLLSILIFSVGALKKHGFSGCCESVCTVFLNLFR